MTIITIDIETLPDLRPGAKQAFIDDAAESFKAPSTLTKEQAANELGIYDKEMLKATSKDGMVERWLERFREEKSAQLAEENWRKTSFSGLTGQLLMIGLAIDDEAPFVLTGDESEALGEFKRVLADVQAAQNMGLPTFVGHNLTDFDLPFIFHRSVMLGVAPHITFAVSPSRYSERIYDTMSKWAGFGNRVKLDTLAQAFGVGSKGDIDGSMVYDYYAAGRINELIEYCANDVAMTRAVYKRMTFYDLRVAA